MTWGFKGKIRVFGNKIAEALHFLIIFQYLSHFSAEDGLIVQTGSHQDKGDVGRGGGVIQKSRTRLLPYGLKKTI